MEINDEKTVLVGLSTEELNPVSFIDFVRSPKAGAIVYFGGTTRDSFQGKQVTYLEYDAYKPLAKRTLSRIAEESRSKWPVEKIALVHRLGEVPVCEDSIIIVLSTPHRQQGWQAAEWVLEQVKASVEIWKNEHYEDGTATWKTNADHCGCEKSTNS